MRQRDRSTWARRALITAAAVSLVLTACSEKKRAAAPPSSPSVSATSPVASSSTPAPTPTTASPTPTPSSSSSPPPAPSASASIDPAAQPAIDTYGKFDKARNYIIRKPPGLGDKLDPKGDFRPVTFSPFQGEFAAFVGFLAQNKVSFKGTPPRPRLAVKSVDLAAKPYPKVVLVNCPTVAPTWISYNADGKPTPTRPGAAKPPYASTVTVIKYQGHWGISESKTDTGNTCTV